MDLKKIKTLIWNDKTEEIKALISENIDYYINFEDKYKKTLLIYAANNANLELVKFLVENSADVNHLDQSNNSPIYFAAYNFNLELIQYLLDNGADININPIYSIPSLIGEMSRNIEGNTLLKKIIDEVKLIRFEDFKKVMLEENMEILKYILESRSIPKKYILDSIDEYLYNKATKEKELFEFLLDNEYISIDDKSSSNESLFSLVVTKSDNLELAKYLLAKGVDLDLDSNGLNALLYMANRDNLEGVKYFIAKGIDINSVDYYGQTALHTQSSRYMGYNFYKEENLSKTLEYLVNEGIDLTHKDNSSTLAIQQLQYHKRKLSVKYLFEKTINAILIKDVSDEDKFDSLFSMQDLASNKKEKDLIINALSSFPSFIDKLVKQLSDAKTKLREIAVKVLIKLDDSDNLELLRERFELESNKALLKVLKLYLDKKLDRTQNRKEVLRNPKDYKKNTSIYFEVLAENSSLNIAISWLKTKDLPNVFWAKSKDVLSLKTLKYLLKQLKDNKVDDEFINLINSNSLVDLFNILHSMPNKITKDEIWIFNILFILAEKDSKYIDMITERIQKFIDYSRWTIGAKLLYTLADLENIDAVKKVDYYSRKSRHKGIRNEAESALIKRARKENLYLDDFRDSLISDFGFNEDKELSLDYGNRKIIAKLMPDFKYVFKNDTSLGSTVKEKTFKTLPKPNKKDNEEIAKKSIESFKKIKKEIKDILKTQKEKLEIQFKVLSLKEFSKWQALYIKNPVLNIFASNLFWGIYDDKNKLKTIFRYNEDNSFSDINDDEVIFKESDKVALVHPVELKEKELNKLKELIEDYEIIQPLEQVNRKFFITDSKEKSLTDFEGIKVYTKSSHYKLLNLGWERGAIVDNGWFEDYVMNFPKLRVVFEFSGTDMFLEYGDKTVTWGKVRFGKTLLSKVNKRTYSEVYRALDIASQTRVE